MAKQETAAELKKTAKPGQEVGESGTLILDGIITLEEFNKDLTGKTGLDIFDRMRRTDATVRAALMVCKLPIISAKWYIEPYSQDPIDLEVAEFIEDQLFQKINWKSFMREGLTELDFGFSIFELVYNITKFNKKEYIGLEKLGSRKQTSLFAWQTKDKKPGIEQMLPAGGSRSIPREKLLIITHEQEGENYEGISLLRAAYKHWYAKDGMYKIDMLAQERHGLGVIKIVFPVGADTKQKNKAREIVREFRANEESYVEHPEGWAIDFADMKAGTIRNPIQSILHHDRQILKSVLAQFLDLGAQGSAGSYALSEDHSKLFIQALEAEADNIKESIVRDVITRLVRLNFGDEVAIPKLCYESLGTPDVAKLTAAAKTLVDGGVIKPDFEIEQHFRQMIGLPLRDEDDAAMEELMAEMDTVIAEVDAAEASDAEAAAAATIPEPPVEDAEQASEPHTAGAPGVPLSEETKRKISEALKRAGKKKGKKGKKGPSKETIATRALRKELRDFATQMQIDIAKKRANGQEISKQDAAQMRVALLIKKQQVQQKIDKIQLKAKEPQDLDDTLFLAKEALNDVQEIIVTEREAQ